MFTAALSIQQIRNELILSGLFSERCQLEAIPGGAVNKSFVLLDKQARYFVKVFACDVMVNIDRAEQFSVQKHLAVAGLAPRPCYLSADQHFQVDEWAQGQSLLEAKLTNTEKYQYLANTLANIHSLEKMPTFNLAALDLPAKWREYLASMQTELDLPDMQHLEARWYSMTNEYSCVCHNDVSLQHVLFDASGIVFDWEYAAYSSPYFDIASSLLINHTDLACEHILLAQYAVITGIPLSEVAQKVALMKPIASLTSQLWFAAAKMPVAK
ncbi:MAG: phosphotransferase [Paraglaciecola sp.]|nr:phosphotransferase [Paraglaciecola sp.]